MQSRKRIDHDLALDFERAPTTKPLAGASEGV